MPARTVPSAPRLRVGFILARSFTLSPFSLFVDTLRLAADEADRSRRIHADWDVMASRDGLIGSSCGIAVAPTAGLLDPAQFHYIVVVGGLLTEAQPVDAETIAYLRRADRRRVTLIGLCTGSFILAGAGLMGDHESCVSWICHDAFRQRFPDHRLRSDHLFALEGRRGSCAGGSGAADMAAEIVRRHISHHAERKALDILQIDKARRASGIQVRKPLSIACDDPRLKAALIAMENSSDGSLQIAELARRVGLSRRQLERLFVAQLHDTPAAIYKRLRLDRARQLLALSRSPLTEIAFDLGFDNVSHFARLFKRTYGVPPGQFRSKAQGARADPGLSS
ncbi:GlxA family transcriptional regulator [Paracoccus yeei]|uniref:GlxA family transcriptional regulator n=1 Tax=Paracoccus yeei TaxID=147645 RepID=UPI003BF8B871